MELQLLAAGPLYGLSEKADEDGGGDRIHDIRQMRRKMVKNCVNLFFQAQIGFRNEGE